MKFKDLPNHSLFSFKSGNYTTERVSLKLEDNKIFSLSKNRTETVVNVDMEVKLVKMSSYVSYTLPDKEIETIKKEIKTIKDVKVGQKFKFAENLCVEYKRVRADEFHFHAIDEKTSLVFPVNEQKEVVIVG